MSGRVLRAVCTAAVVLAAVGAVAPAGAEPSPSPVPSPPMSPPQPPSSSSSSSVSAQPSPSPSPSPSPAEKTARPVEKTAPPVTTTAPPTGKSTPPGDGDATADATAAEPTAGETVSDAATAGVTVDASDAFPSPAPSRSDAPDDADTPNAALSTAPNAAPGSVPALLTELQTLFRRTEEATERYNATAEKLELRKAATRKANDAFTQARLALDSGRAAAGRLAREQYQGRSDFSLYLRLLLADGPSDAFDQSHVIDRAAAGRAATVARLTEARKRADVLAAAARKALDEQQALAAEQRRQRDSVRARLTDVEKRLAALTPAQLAGVSALEEKNTDAAQKELVASGALGSAEQPTRRGAEAVAYAIEQIGKPYEWGAEGPDTFDCSGLTMRAWERAGLPVPRTSQEQWAELARIPVSSLRPGDLVVYFPEATHVALYIGDGLVVQAPRPGAKVKVSPLASNPLLGAVRPDPEGVPLASYTRPGLPEGASEGADTGYSASTEPE